MSSKDLKEITYKLIKMNLEVSHKNYTGSNTRFCTAVKVCPISNIILQIMVNIKEIRLGGRTDIIKRLGVKSVYLKVLLHEIAHVKQIRKFKGYCFVVEYNNKTQYYEDMADRYARLNYKKVLKALKERQTA